MSVLFTVAVLALLAMWGLAVYNRLIRLRRQIKRAWTELDAGRKEGDVGGARQGYNDLASKYNHALQVFPGNIIAALAGFRPAQQLTVNC